MTSKFLNLCKNQPPRKSPPKTKYFILFISLISLSFLFLSPSPAFSQISVSLAWDSVPGVTGYRVYYGLASRSYSNSIATGAPNCTITGLSKRETYYFAVTAVSGNLESDYSDEVVSPPQLGIFRRSVVPVAKTSTTRTTASTRDLKRTSRLAYWHFDSNRNGRMDACNDDDCLGPFGGNPEDIPVVGNWAGNGKRIGIFRNGRWFFDHDNDGTWDDCGLNFCITNFIPFQLGDVPVVGDWTGNGITKIGIYREGEWFLDLNGNGRWDPGVDRRIADFGGDPDDVPVVGDWTGDGRTKVGVYRNGMWYLDRTGNANWGYCGADVLCLGPFGGATSDIPVAGDWNGDGKSEIGIFRLIPPNGYWYLDVNGNGRWDGPAADKTAGPFGGNLRDVPLVR